MKMRFVPVLIISALFCGVVLAEDGITSNKIVLGQSCALKGPASSLGIGMNNGLKTYFDKINVAGGVNGRSIELIALNDGYEPERCKVSTNVLINNNKVFLLIGEVGTPTSTVAVPIAEAAKVPFVAPFTGAEFLRNPFKRYVVNIRASYYQEMEALAAYLVDKLGHTKVACFYQNDSYGQAGLAGIKLALERRNMQLSAEGTYERNTLAVGIGLNAIAQAQQDAVVMVGAYKPCAQFIKLAKENTNLQNSVFCNISFVGTKALLSELGEVGNGCIVSQVVPYPWDTSLPLVNEYNQAMRSAGLGDEIGFISLEGYMAAKFFCMVMERIEGDPSREKFLDTLEAVGTFDLGGVTLGFGPEDHQGMEEVFLTVFRGGNVELLEQ